MRAINTIGVCGSLSPACEATLHALGTAFGVRIERRRFAEDSGIDAWIVLDADEGVVSEVRRAQHPCYVVVSDRVRIPNGDSDKMTFVSGLHVPAVLRAREVRADDAAAAKVLPRWLDKVEPIAFKDGSPIWASEAGGQCPHHYSALDVPGLDDRQPLFTTLSGRRIAGLLPLVSFLRALSDNEGWEQPPLQATFMFDDPNLHWASYGFVDYAQMAARAAAGQYHVAMATIPLDAWLVNPRACGIFKANPGHLSLLYHGNDHISNELARVHSAAAMDRLLQQAVARITRLERRTGLKVARVMAAPHGACNETALAGMTRLNFEAACVSSGSLSYYNRGADWVRTIGMKPCEIVEGLPIVPRFGLSTDCGNNILIAALLRQPIIPITHHEAVADGYELLDKIAGFVNSLGDVVWRDMTSISRSLFAHRQDGPVLRVKMFSRHVRVRLPPGTTHVHLKHDRQELETQQPLFWRTADRSSGNGNWQPAVRDGCIHVNGSGAIEIVVGPSGPDSDHDRRAGRRRLIPTVRRVLTEARDRALPSFRRFVGTSHPTSAS